MSTGESIAVSLLPLAAGRFDFCTITAGSAAAGAARASAPAGALEAP